jgi:DNA (cytosine-5)-methyltransferase 1
MGLHLAGFDVTGVDIEHHPTYPFTFQLGDALTVPLEGYDLIWASPPCQAYTRLRSRHKRSYPDLISQVRERLQATGTPFIIENVPGAPLHRPLLLCGTMFGLGVSGGELRRHRLFEMSFSVPQPACQHGREPATIGVYGNPGGTERRNPHLPRFPIADWKRAMGIDWMDHHNLTQAIPPTYSRYIGEAALHVLQAAA